MGEVGSHSWFSIVGTALSGLGATVNGLNSLHSISSQVLESLTEDWELSGQTLASSVVGGAAAASGWFTVAKFGGATSAMSATSLGLGMGCLYASLGFLYFAHTIVRMNTTRPPKHAPVEGSQEAVDFPSPQWLSTRVLNWGVMGRVGAGKSTLINSLRGLKAQDPEAAPVGVGHTTRRPSPYSFVGDVATLTRNMARLWDLPGAGTRDWPATSYVKDAGLRHFDGIICVTAGAFSESEADLIGQLRSFKVPYYVVRNKVDQDAVNNEQDNGATVQETLAEIRNELLENGCDPARTFLISAKHPDCPHFDFGLLLRVMAADVSVIRGELPEFKEEASFLLAAAKQRHALADCPHSVTLPEAIPELPGSSSSSVLDDQGHLDPPNRSGSPVDRRGGQVAVQVAVPPLFKGWTK